MDAAKMNDAPTWRQTKILPVRPSSSLTAFS
jgi:hypothetical protein